jgi:hypothetical protein
MIRAKKSPKILGGKKRWANARQWLKHRRENVTKAVEIKADDSSSKTRRFAISKLAKSMCTERHEKERKFNQTKELNRRHLNHIVVSVFYGLGIIRFKNPLTQG